MMYRCVAKCLVESKSIGQLTIVRTLHTRFIFQKYKVRLPQKLMSLKLNCNILDIQDISYTLHSVTNISIHYYTAHMLVIDHVSPKAWLKTSSKRLKWLCI